jgi:REP element-mobilizing transposase RayT
MPRRPRVDVEGALYHVIARGVERRAIFRDDRDRSRFVERLSALVGEESVELFAYVLLDNHFHLVLRRHQTALGQFMRRLLTGYTVTFNRRHRRVGHLFQNRYKSVLCKEDSYLLQLVRYVHLNPVRARIVTDPADYRWSSHGEYLRRRAATWLSTAEVLEQLGGRAAYRRFIADGHGEGKRPDLCGVAIKADAEEAEGQSRLWLGSQVLGDDRFARSMAKATRRRAAEREMEHGRTEDLPRLAERVAARCGVAARSLSSPGRPRAVSTARRELIRVAVCERRIRAADVARFLRISTASVAAHLRALERQNLAF